jgi:uncharacterized membrane protein
MEALLHELSRCVALVVEAIATVLIAVGALEALVNIARIAATPRSTGNERREVWLEFSRWLVAALTFQLAADILATSFSPGWDELGRVGAIAAIRTFLSYFLDREVETTRSLQQVTSVRASSG